MEKRTFERALHAWEPWHDSIRQSRDLLGYDEKWPKQTCLEWIYKHYGEISERAASELKRLELPPTLKDYWEDCFYSDYRKRGTSDYSKIMRCLSEPKSLPALPCTWGVVWHEDEDPHDPWLRLEIRMHARFATREVFDFAAGHAFRSARRYIAETRPHPVCRWLKGGRPAAEATLAEECVHLKDDLKMKYKEIGNHFGWPLQENSYGRKNQCSKARRYVKMGRKLRENTNQKPSL